MSGPPKRTHGRRPNGALGSRAPTPRAGLFNEAEWEARDGWHFQLVLDYGEHPPVSPSVEEVRPWPIRIDPFSTYRAGLEIRTYRLCRRALMFHHFEEELGPGLYLVRSTDLAHDQNPIATQLREAATIGSAARNACRSS